MNWEAHLDGVKPGVFKVGPVERHLGMRLRSQYHVGVGLEKQTLRI
jgi:hypothetical protein